MDDYGMILDVNSFQREALKYRDDGLVTSEQVLNELLKADEQVARALSMVRESMFCGHELDKQEASFRVGRAIRSLAVATWFLGHDLDTVLQKSV